MLKLTRMIWANVDETTKRGALTGTISLRVSRATPPASPSQTWQTCVSLANVRCLGQAVRAEGACEVRLSAAKGCALRTLHEQGRVEGGMKSLALKGRRTARLASSNTTSPKKDCLSPRPPRRKRSCLLRVIRTRRRARILRSQSRLEPSPPGTPF